MTRTGARIRIVAMFLSSKMAKAVIMAVATLGLVLPVTVVVVRAAEETRKLEPTDPERPQSKGYAGWSDALAAATWGDWAKIPPAAPRMLPGGPRDTRNGQEQVAIIGRLFLNRRDRGSLAAGERYEEFVRFEPAVSSGPRGAGERVIIGEDLKEEVLNSLRRKGDLPAVVRGTFRQTRVNSHDGLNSSTQTELAVAKCEWLDLQQAAEGVAQLVPEAAAREAYLKRLQPVEVGALRIFFDQRVVHPNLPGHFTSQILLSFRAFNGSAEPVELPTPVVRMRLGERWIEAGPTLGGLRSVAAGGWSDRDAAGGEFCIYKPESPAQAGEEVELEISFSAGGKKAVHREKVSVLGVAGRGGR